MPTLPLAARVVEVIADRGEASHPRYRYGSGCVVAGQTVLTAAHVVTGAVRILVRDPDKVVRDATLDPGFVGDVDGPRPDLALVEINDTAVNVPAMRLAALDRDSPSGELVERCHVLGFPAFMERDTPEGGTFRETADAVGHVPVLSQLARGLLSVQVSAAPRPLPPENVALGDSEWSGMSGAPVVADGHLLGVVTEHALREGPSAITATPLTALEADPEHPGWGPGVANPGAWWARLGVSDARALRRLPDRRLRDLPAHCRAASHREIRDLGQKYIAHLYFPPEVIESRFTTFLNSPATCFLIVSKPGRGKTNLLCHLTYQLQDERPVLFLTCRSPISSADGLLSLVAARLDYGDEWQACLTDLVEVGNGVPPLILLDGINESPAPPEIMREALHELLVRADRAGVKVCITCRTDFWQFYRASFWGAYLTPEDRARGETRTIVPRGEDLPLFAVESFPEITRRYFAEFHASGKLVGDAADRCRNPLMLRIFCEAYRGRNVGVVRDLRLYLLFKLFWQRKAEQVAEIKGLKQPDAVAGLVLTVARLMRQRKMTIVPRSDVAAAIAQGAADLDSSESLYNRVLDEEIILEENVDEEAGIRNIIFVYDRFAEYAISLSVYTDESWATGSEPSIVSSAERLMEEEHRFATLRGVLEFLVCRLQDRRREGRIHFSVLNAMITRDWKWRRIGTLLAFQLDPSGDPEFWPFVSRLATDESDFVRRLVAEQIGGPAGQELDQALPLIGSLVRDDSRSVREAARQSVLEYPPERAIPLARCLADSPDLPGFAAQLLLWPMNRDLQALKEKVRQLAREQPHAPLRRAVMQYLKAPSPKPPYNDLFDMEELLAVFQDDPDRELEDYVRTIQATRGRLEELLNDDLEGLELFRGNVSRVWNLTRKYLRLRREEVPVVLQATLQVLVPDDGERRNLSAELTEEIAEWRDPRHASQEPLVALAWREACAKLRQSHPYPRIFDGHSWHVPDYKGIVRLWEISEHVLNSISTPATAHPLLTSLDGGETSEHGVFREKLAADYRLVLTKRDHRVLSSVGRLVLWIWHQDSLVQEQEHELVTRSREMSRLSPAALLTRFEVHQRLPLNPAGQDDLDLDVRALCYGYRDRPALVAQVIAPLAIWHDERNSPALLQAMDTLHQRDRDMFWRLAQALLEYADQRVVDIADRLVDQADIAEEHEPAPEIISGIAAIIDEIAGVPPEEVAAEKNFVEDLDIDSLSMVEIAVAVQDQFDVEVSDNDLLSIRTVGQLAELIREGMRDRPAGNRAS